MCLFFQAHKYKKSEKNLKLMPPTFGLKFIEDNKNTDRNFKLLCGFEKFDEYFQEAIPIETELIKILDEHKDNLTNAIGFVNKKTNEFYDKLFYTIGN